MKGQPLQFLLLLFAGWVNRKQVEVLEYLKEENRVLREQLGGRRLQFSDDQRRRLAVRGRVLGRKVLSEVTSLLAPDTILRWYRQLIAAEYDGTARRGTGRPRTAQSIEELVVRFARENVSWGYRRATRLVNRQLASESLPTVNHKRVYRVMREHQLLLQRYTGKSTRTHDGVIITLKSNLRWCSDSFEIRCWNGERVQVAFSLDCCDREAMSYVATTGAIDGEMIRDLMTETLEYRFGAGVERAPHPVEWLSDNGPPYTARETCAFGSSLGFVVCTTPSYSPESNGMAEAFVKTFKRDYVYLHRLETAATVLTQLHGWFEDYNEVHPHRGLKMLSPREYRRASVHSAAS